MNPALVPKSFLRWRAFRASSFVAALAVFAAVVSSGHAQGTMTIIFEGEPVGSTTPTSVYNESGMQFSNPYGAQNLVLAGGGINTLPQNGTGYLQVSAGADLGFSFLSGAHFNLDAFDAAGYGTNYGSASLVIVGYKSMGVLVTNLFTVDSLSNRRTSALPDFQTFHLDSQFQNVFRVDVLTDRWSLDNLVISGVPEPTTGSLALVGTGGAVAWSRFRRKHPHRRTHS